MFWSLPGENYEIHILRTPDPQLGGTTTKDKTSNTFI
jgi:hypothetical protein